MYVLRDNRPKIEILTYPELIINPEQNFLKKFVNIIFKINYYFSCRLKQTGAISVPPFSFYFLNKVFTVI